MNLFWNNSKCWWSDLNTTRMAKNALKVSVNGDVCILVVGRRTITTANAYQKMLKPAQGVSSWNEFVRVYDTNFSAPKYSSLIGGTWNPVTGVGGDNKDLFGVCTTNEGVVVVGRHVANETTGAASGNAIPIVNVVPWGNAAPNGESAILLFYKPSTLANVTLENAVKNDIVVYPNPANSFIIISFSNQEIQNSKSKFSISDMLGRDIL